MLPVVLPRDQVLELLDDAEQRLELEIDLATAEGYANIKNAVLALVQ